ncbi:hypothetical protein HDZ31DRAFT_62052 [Schizophyllum fasciatum]
MLENRSIPDRVQDTNARDRDALLPLAAVAELSSNGARVGPPSPGAGDAPSPIGQHCEAPKVEGRRMGTTIPTLEPSDDCTTPPLRTPTHHPHPDVQKQLDDLHAAIRALRTDNTSLRLEIARLKDAHASSVADLRSEIAVLQAALRSKQARPVAPSASLLRSGQASCVRNSETSSRFLRAQATMLAAERAEALLAGLSPDARRALRPNERPPLSALFTTSGTAASHSKKPLRKSGSHEPALSAIDIDGATSSTENPGLARMLSLSRNETLDALAASHAVLELQQICSQHGASSLDSLDSLLSDDHSSASAYSGRGSSPEKVNVSPFASSATSPYTPSRVSSPTGSTSVADLDVPLGLHPVSLVRTSAESLDDTVAVVDDTPPADASGPVVNSSADLVTQTPPQPQQHILPSTSKSRIPIPGERI